MRGAPVAGASGFSMVTVANNTLAYKPFLLPAVTITLVPLGVSIS